MGTGQKSRTMKGFISMLLFLLSVVGSEISVADLAASFLTADVADVKMSGMATLSVSAGVTIPMVGTVFLVSRK